VSWDFEVYAPGSSAVGRVALESWEECSGRYFRRIPASDVNGIPHAWRREREVVMRKRQRRCEADVHEIDVATPSRALHQWRNTRGVLVRGDRPLFSKPFVGVVCS
jgi:hypothetical protein